MHIEAAQVISHVKFSGSSLQRQRFDTELGSKRHVDEIIDINFPQIT